MKVGVFIVVVLVVFSALAYAEPVEPSDPAKEITQTVTEWGKQQITDYIKSIFKPREDEQAETDCLSFGVMLIQIGYVAAYGWLISFIMPSKIASLIRTTTFIACIQIIFESVTKMTA